MGLNDNDPSRMSSYQLLQRIQQMETTAHRNSTVGALNDRHRPMEDRKRNEKIARYREELACRDRNDAAHAEADARDRAKLDAQTVVCPSCDGTGSVPHGDHGSRACHTCHRTGRVQPEPAPSDPPCDCHFAGDTADASDCPAHGDAPMPRRYDDPYTETDRGREEQAVHAGADWHANAAATDDRRYQRDIHCDPQAQDDAPTMTRVTVPPAVLAAIAAQQQPAPRILAGSAEDKTDYGPAPAIPTHTLHAVTPVIPAPPASPTPGQRPGHSRARYHTDPDEPKPGPAMSHVTPGPDLAATMRQLLDSYSSGEIIDAAWDVSAAMFREALAKQDLAARNGGKAQGA